MEILIVHDEQLKNYATKAYEYLTSAGYSVVLTDVANYDGSLQITTVPTFLIRKSGKDGYAVKGKQPLDVILNWARNSGAGN